MNRLLLTLPLLGGCLLAWQTSSTCADWCEGMASWVGVESGWTTEFTSVEMECSSEGRFCGSADVRAKGQGEESLASCAEVCMTFFHEGQSLSCAPACTYLNDVNHFSVAYFTREDDTDGDHGGAIFEGNTQQLLGCSQTHAFTSDAQSMRCCCVSRDSMAFDPEIMQ